MSESNQIDIPRHVEGRSCGSCSLCCKVYDVPEIQKTAGKWCQFFKSGKGCTIHDKSPNQCREFFCNWMTHASLGPEWKPDRCRFVMTTNPYNLNLTIQVDPGFRSAWKEKQYYDVLKQWALKLMERDNYIFVFDGITTFIVLPDRDEDIGVIGQNQKVYFNKRIINGFLRIEVEKR